MPVCILVTLRARQWNLLAVGDDWAASRGVSTTTLTVVGYIAGSFLTGLVTSLTGPIGFVGLIVPHALRMKLGADHRVLLPCSFLARRGVPVHLRYTVANRDRTHRNSRRRHHRAGRRTVLHLAAAIETEKPVAIILIGGGARSGKSRLCAGTSARNADRAWCFWPPLSPSTRKWRRASPSIAPSAARNLRPSKSRSKSPRDPQDGGCGRDCRRLPDAVALEHHAHLRPGRGY